MTGLSYARHQHHFRYVSGVRMMACVSKPGAVGVMTSLSFIPNILDADTIVFMHIALSFLIKFGVKCKFCCETLFFSVTVHCDSRSIEAGLTVTPSYTPCK